MNTDQRTDAELNRIVVQWQIEGIIPYPGSGVMAYFPKGGGIFEAGRIPAYCTDLNACAEAEKKLLKDGKPSIAYANFVWEIVGRDNGNPEWAYEACILATARQRTEALVRVIEEGK